MVLLLSLYANQYAWAQKTHVSSSKPSSVCQSLPFNLEAFVQESTFVDVSNKGALRVSKELNATLQIKNGQVSFFVEKSPDCFVEVIVYQSMNDQILNGFKKQLSHLFQKENAFETLLQAMMAAGLGVACASLMLTPLATVMAIVFVVYLSSYAFDLAKCFQTRKCEYIGKRLANDLVFSISGLTGAMLASKTGLAQILASKLLSFVPSLKNISLPPWLYHKTVFMTERGVDPKLAPSLKTPPELLNLDPRNGGSLLSSWLNDDVYTNGPSVLTKAPPKPLVPSLGQTNVQKATYNAQPWTSYTHPQLSNPMATSVALTLTQTHQQTIDLPIQIKNDFNLSHENNFKPSVQAQNLNKEKCLKKLQTKQLIPLECFFLIGKEIQDVLKNEKLSEEDKKYYFAQKAVYALTVQTPFDIQPSQNFIEFWKEIHQLENKFWFNLMKLKNIANNNNVLIASGNSFLVVYYDQEKKYVLKIGLGEFGLLDFQKMFSAFKILEKNGYQTSQPIGKIHSSINNLNQTYHAVLFKYLNHKNNLFNIYDKINTDGSQFKYFIDNLHDYYLSIKNILSSNQINIDRYNPENFYFTGHIRELNASILSNKKSEIQKYLKSNILINDVVYPSKLELNSSDSFRPNRWIEYIDEHSIYFKNKEGDGVFDLANNMKELYVYNDLIRSDDHFGSIQYHYNNINQSLDINSFYIEKFAQNNGLGTLILKKIIDQITKSTKQDIKTISWISPSDKVHQQFEVFLLEKINCTSDTPKKQCFEKFKMLAIEQQNEVVINAITHTSAFKIFKNLGYTVIRYHGPKLFTEEDKWKYPSIGLNWFSASKK